MKSVHFPIIAFLFLMVGCAPVQYPTVPQQKPTVSHQYELSVVDVDGNPLAGVKVDYELKDNERLVESTSYVTKSDGKVSASLTVTPDPRYTYSTLYKSEFDYKASKNGYYSKSGELSKFEYSTYTQPETKTITLIRPIDYLNKEFAATLSDVKLKTKILSFIDLIILQGLVTESVLETQSVNLVPFKGNNYLQFKFTNVNVYNSLKLNKYDIGKRLFDEVVRKVLTPLNEHVAESNLFYGYDLTVVGHTKSFAEEYATAKPIEYRFMIPENIVRQYKNKDISGQQVLDASVVLMDDERIELKLQ
jgi:hypothetical protein